MINSIHFIKAIILNLKLLILLIILLIILQKLILPLHGLVHPFLAELTNANIPFISVPLPSSADNHQLEKCNIL